MKIIGISLSQIFIIASLAILFNSALSYLWILFIPFVFISLGIYVCCDIFSNGTENEYLKKITSTAFNFCNMKWFIMGSMYICISNKQLAQTKESFFSALIIHGIAILILSLLERLSIKNKES